MDHNIFTPIFKKNDEILKREVKNKNHDFLKLLFHIEMKKFLFYKAEKHFYISNNINKKFYILHQLLLKIKEIYKNKINHNQNKLVFKKRSQTLL